MTELMGISAIVTGGTSGIGLATAAALLRGGANVLINARRPAPEAQGGLKAIAVEHGRRCLLVAGDMREPQTSQLLVDSCLETFGRIDTVVHAAGGAAPGTIMDLSHEAWLDAFDVHVNSTFHLFRAAHAALASSNGSMTLLSSAAGLRGCPGTIAYQVVKASLIQLARALARDHAREGIRVNCVAPGIIRTPFQSGMTEAAKLNNLANRIPLGREGTPEQVASLILQLIQNDFITGETMVIDGGMSMRMV
jgi:NAD(P)-dependent dehydrogenase (short-subunit alcohol dehydrogenase family)